MADVSALSTATTAATALANLILVSPQTVIGYQPQNAPSFSNNTAVPQPALLFNYEGEQSVSLESDITDHYIEDNTAIQDQIALRPETITTSGFIGELNDVTPAALQPLKTVAQKLTPLASYGPSLSQTALLAYVEAQFLYQVGQAAANSAVSAWSSINGRGGETVINGAGVNVQPNQTKQQQFFQQFYGYWRSRTLFTVQTPWAVFQDMAIKSLRAVQDPETRVITDFQVTFKLLRFASTQVTSSLLFSPDGFQGRSALQAAVRVNLGLQSPPPAALSFTSALGGGR